MTDKKMKKDWTWQDFIEDLYKKVLPKVYSRLAKIEARLAELENSDS